MHKGQWGWKKTRSIFISVVIAAGSIGGSSPVAAESIEDLKATMAQMKQAMEAMELRIATMEQEKVEEGQTAQAVAASDSVPPIALKVAENTTMSIYEIISARFHVFWGIRTITDYKFTLKYLCKF